MLWVYMRPCGGSSMKQLQTQCSCHSSKDEHDCGTRSSRPGSTHQKPHHASTPREEYVITGMQLIYLDVCRSEQIACVGKLEIPLQMSYDSYRGAYSHRYCRCPPDTAEMLPEISLWLIYLRIDPIWIVLELLWAQTQGTGAQGCKLCGNLYLLCVYPG